jgi:hypothetical protein
MRTSGRKSPKRASCFPLNQPRSSSAPPFALARLDTSRRAYSETLASCNSALAGAGLVKGTARPTAGPTRTRAGPPVDRTTAHSTNSSSVPKKVRGRRVPPHSTRAAGVSGSCPAAASPFRNGTNQVDHARLRRRVALVQLVCAQRGDFAVTIGKNEVGDTAGEDNLPVRAGVSQCRECVGAAWP